MKFPGISPRAVVGADTRPVSGVLHLTRHEAPPNCRQAHQSHGGGASPCMARPARGRAVSLQRLIASHGPAPVCPPVEVVQ